jgi:MFS transporter, DHA1 family, multidrug resistance protein
LSDPALTEVGAQVEVASVSDHAAAASEARWRQNVYLLGFASLIGSASMSFTGPFLPLYLSRELGITDSSSLASWTGTISAAMGISLAITSPIWGMVADRYGRKPMLIRALAGTGIFTALMSIAQEPWQAAAFRLGFGAVTGILHTSLAVVAGQAPRGQMGWALGVITSAFVTGGALGPVIAGLAEPLLGLRAVFLAGGIALGLTALLVAVMMTETRASSRGSGPSVFRQLRRLEGPTATAVIALFVAQVFLIMTTGGAQPMIALRLLELSPTAAAAATGTAFGLFGFAAAGAALLYARPARRIGYRGVAFIACGILGIGLISATTSSVLQVLVISMGLMGLASGSLQPLVRTMLGLEAPKNLVATLYGLNNSAVAVGIAIGPLAAGTIAANSGAQWGIGSALVPLALVVVTLLFVREPVP